MSKLLTLTGTVAEIAEVARWLRNDGYGTQVVAPGVLVTKAPRKAIAFQVRLYKKFGPPSHHVRNLGRRHGNAGGRVAPLRVYDMLRVFRAKYKSDGVPSSVVDGVISTYYDAMQAIKQASYARDRPADVAELREHFHQLIKKLDHDPIVAHLDHVQNVIGEGKMAGQTWVSKPPSPGFSLRNLYARALQSMQDDFYEALA